MFSNLLLQLNMAKDIMFFSALRLETEEKIKGLVTFKKANRALRI